MEPYDVSYSSKFGTDFVAVKMADSPDDALDAVKAAHKKISLSAAVGVITYGKPKPHKTKAQRLSEVPAKAAPVAFIPAPPSANGLAA